MEITKCRACGGELIEFLDLGEQYLSDFRNDDSRPARFPLVAVLCDICKLVQLKHSTPPNEMYHERYGFKSGISSSIRDDLDDVVRCAFQYVNDPKTWLDIASNDGTLLSFVPNDIYRVGVDPVKFLCEEASPYANWIINNFFDTVPFLNYEGDNTCSQYDQFNVITSVSCFYDMPQPEQFVQDVLTVLAPYGVWVIQQNYLLTTMQLSAVDNFCHEHLSYYTLLSLENLLNRFGLEVNEVQLSAVNGGSLRTVVSRKGTFAVDGSVQQQRDVEAAYGVDDIEAYREFAASIDSNLNKLRRLIDVLNAQDNRIVILAASTRGATIWQAINLTNSDIAYAVERNPAKVGRRFSAIDVLIMSEEFFHADKPDYALIGPWFYGQEVAQRELEFVNAGGSLILPLPEVRVITKDTIHGYLGDLAANVQAAA